MVERIRNVNKRDAKKLKRPLSEPDVKIPSKRRVKGNELLRRYPTSIVNDVEGDAASLQQHTKAIATELARSKTRDSVLLPLMRSTYGPRRLFVLNDAESISTILDAHPALFRPAVVCVFLYSLASLLPVLSSFVLTIDFSVMFHRLNRRWGSLMDVLK